jgi:hypothetical protein
VQYGFEDYVLDPERRELARGSEAIAVGPQVFDLLLYLLQNRAHVVSKDGLLDDVWGGRIVSESTLTSHINAARRAIGDSGQEHIPDGATEYTSAYSLPWRFDAATLTVQWQAQLTSDFLPDSNDWYAPTLSPLSWTLPSVAWTSSLNSYSKPSSLK